MRPSIQRQAAITVTVRHRLAKVKAEVAPLGDSGRDSPASGSRCWESVSQGRHAEESLLLQQREVAATSRWKRITAKTKKRGARVGAKQTLKAQAAAGKKVPPLSSGNSPAEAPGTSDKRNSEKSVSPGGLSREQVQFRIDFLDGVSKGE